MVSAPAFMQVRDSLTFEAKNFTRLTTCRDFKFGFTIQCGYLYLVTEGGLSKIDR